MKACRARILSLFFIAALLLTGCTPAAPPPEEPLLPFDLEQIVREAIPPLGEIRHAGAALSEEDQQLYAMLVGALDGLVEEISFYNRNIESLERAFNAVLDDYPEFFWLTGAYRWGGWDSLSFLWFEPETLPALDAVEGQREQAEAAVGEILAQAEGLSEYERALFFHDYLIEHTTYDAESAQAILDKGVNADTRTAYGCLVEHSAVCSGYARAFQWLAQRSGLECMRVNGKDTTDDIGHEWNCIRLDGDYYYVDVTWDDPIPEEGEPEILTHNYFCITTEELLCTHVFSDGQDLPDCTATDYDYFRMQGLYFEEYDPEQVGQRIRDLIDSGEREFSIKFASADECVRAETDLFNGQRFFEYASELESISYGLSDDKRILTFLL